MLDDDRLLPLNVVAKRLSVHVATVRVWCHEGKIEFIVLPNGHFRIRSSSVGKCLRNGKDHLDSLMER